MNKKILIYGYGNPGRMDDGLGNQLIDLLDAVSPISASLMKIIIK